MKTLEPILKEHLFFKKLDSKYIKLITGCATNARFKAGEFVFKEGQNADKFYLIREGKIALQIPCPAHGAITIQTVSSNEVLGFSWLFSPYKWSFDAKVIEEVRVLEIDGKCLRKKCEEDHDLGYELQKRFAQIMLERLQATRLQLLDLYETPSKKR